MAKDSSKYIFKDCEYLYLILINNFIISSFLLYNDSKYNSLFPLIAASISFALFLISPILKSKITRNIIIISEIIYFSSTIYYGSLQNPFSFNAIALIFLMFYKRKNSAIILLCLFLDTIINLTIISSIENIHTYYNPSISNTVTILTFFLPLIILLTYKYNLLVNHDEIQQQNIKLANKNLNVFLSRISHQVRTPLNNFLGSLNYLLYNKNIALDHREEKNYLSILESARKLSSTVEKLINFTKLNNNLLALNPNPVNLEHLILRIIQEFYSKCLEQKVVIRYNINNVDNVIKIDEESLYQILQILIENSLDNTFNGKIIIFIRSTKKNLIDITISDTGVGFQNMSSQLFEPLTFNQFGNQENKDGLSLALAKKLVDLQRGHIDILTHKGIGTSIYLELPFLLCQIKEGDDTNTETKFKQILSSRNRIKRILVVDDNPMISKLISLWINVDEYGYIYKKNGQEALDYLQHHDVGIIFMDIQMPVMDGLTATEHIRLKDGNSFDPIIIAISANNSKEDQKRAFAVGVNLFFSKPLNKHKINDCLQLFYTNYKPLEDNNKKTSKIKTHQTSITTPPTHNFMNQLLKEYDNDTEVIEIVIKNFSSSANKYLDIIENLLKEKERLVNMQSNTSNSSNSVNSIKNLQKQINSKVHSLKGDSKSIFFNELSNLLEEKRDNFDSRDLDTTYKLVNIALNSLFKEVA